jgi:type VI secretion system protein ImpL
MQAELLTMTEMERSEHASMVRDRLTDLRQELGIRFPVYVVVTKMDLLRGFSEYFQSLTSEGRAGLGLHAAIPWHEERARRRGRSASPCARRWTGVALLNDRLADGLRARLNEEFDVERRKRLFALPQELAGLAVPLVPMLDEIFLVSRFDRTQLHDTLRGVYFTSGASRCERACRSGHAAPAIAAQPGPLSAHLRTDAAPPARRPDPGSRASSSRTC